MRTWLEIDLNQIARNVDVVRATLPKNCQIIAVVKANAYGHGDIRISEHLERRCGIKMFAVACLEEALHLREGGITGEILVLGYVDPAEAHIAVEKNITLTVVSAEHAIKLSEAAQAMDIKIGCHLKINTGMNRIGFECKTFKQIVAVAGVYKLPGLDFTGIFSHLSSADDSSAGADPYTRLQIERFCKVLSFLSERGIKPGMRHISNSGGTAKYPQVSFDAVRCGALIYGYNTAKDAPLPIKPVMQWKTIISAVRDIDFGDAVSYSRMYIAKGPLKIASICVGYADGLPRSFTNKGYVIINGVKCRSLGAVCMDQMMVDVSKVSGEIRMGDIATIIDEGQSADDLAAYAGTCMHDILAGISARVEKKYY